MRLPQALFLLTRPSRDVTKQAGCYTGWEWISTHTSLAGRDPRKVLDFFVDRISTHTSLAGRDAPRLPLRQ